MKISLSLEFPARPNRNVHDRARGETRKLLREWLEQHLLAGKRKTLIRMVLIILSFDLNKNISRSNREYENYCRHDDSR